MNYPDIVALMNQQVIDGEKRLLIQQICDHPNPHYNLFSANLPLTR